MAIENPNTFIAAAQLNGVPTIEVISSEGFDESSLTRVSAGLYGFTLSEPVDHDKVIVSVNAVSAGGEPLIAVGTVQSDKTTVAISLQNAAGVATDGIRIHVGVWLFKA